MTSKESIQDTQQKADALIAKILSGLEELPDNDAAIEYYMDVEKTVLDIEENIEEFENATPSQITALENIQSGLDKWINR